MKQGELFDVLLGTGDQKGLMRLKRSKTGVAPAMITGKGGAVFRLGFIERFGTESERKQFCSATAMDADTVEIVLPPWADEQDV